jgi:uncharacterized protein
MKRLLVSPRRPPRKRRRLGVLVGTTRFLSSTMREQRFTLDLLDLDAGETVPARIPLDFFGHGLAVHPKRPREAALLEKRGPGGCALDLAARRVVRPIAPMEGHAFYGHAVYSHEGDVLFVVETHLESNQGTVSIRDSSTFAVVATFPTYGMAPHDCHLVEHGRTLVITNGGGPVNSASLPSVAFVDVKTRALLEKHEVLDPNRNTGHVAVAENREFAAVSAPRDGLPAKTSLGGVSLRRQDQPWAHMVAPEVVTSRLVGESLSVAIHGPSRTVVATHPDGDLITFWSLDRGGLIGSLELPGPRGVTVTLDEQLYVVSYGAEARLLLIQARPIRVLPDRQLAPGMFGGAHLYTWWRS